MNLVFRAGQVVEQELEDESTAEATPFGIIKLFEGLSILLRGGLEGLPLILMEFLRVWFEGPV